MTDRLSNPHTTARVRGSVNHTTDNERKTSMKIQYRWVMGHGPVNSYVFVALQNGDRTGDRDRYSINTTAFNPVQHGAPVLYGPLGTLNNIYHAARGLGQIVETGSGDWVRIRHIDDADEIDTALVALGYTRGEFDDQVV